MDAVALKFLKQLMAAPTPSGYEMPGQRIVRDYMRQYADTVRVDVHGNVCGVLNPKAECRVMLAGHCDEIGLMVMHIDDKGFIGVAAVGGVNVPLLQGERVTIHGKKGPVPAVVGAKPIHLLESKEREGGAVRLHEMSLDIGAKSRKDAEKVLALGDVATVDAEWRELRNGLVACRGFDDRVGAFIVSDVLRFLRGRRLKVGVHAVSTVQEEIGLRGARTAALGIDPAIGIAVDVGHATDAPGINAKLVGEASLDRGPILHRGPNFNPRLAERIEKTARQARIKVQMQPVPYASGTDANMIQVSRAGGVAVHLVSVPLRYMHSAVEVLALKDVEATVRLIGEVILGLRGDESFVPLR